MVNKDGSFIKGGYGNKGASGKITTNKVTDKQVRIAHQFDTDWNELGFSNMYYLREDDVENTLEIKDLEVDKFYELGDYNNMKFKGFEPNYKVFMFYDLDRDGFKKCYVKYEDMVKCEEVNIISLSPKQCYKLETLLNPEDGLSLKDKLKSMMDEKFVRKGKAYDVFKNDEKEIRQSIVFTKQDLMDYISKLTSKDDKIEIIDNIINDLENKKEKTDVILENSDKIVKKKFKLDEESEYYIMYENKRNDYFNLTHEINARFTQTLTNGDVGFTIDNMLNLSKKYSNIDAVFKFEKLLKKFKNEFEGFDILSEKNKKKLTKELYKIWKGIVVFAKKNNDKNLAERIIKHMDGMKFITIKPNSKFKGKYRYQGDIENIEKKDKPDFKHLHGLKKPLLQ